MAWVLNGAYLLMPVKPEIFYVVFLTTTPASIVNNTTYPLNGYKPIA